MLSFQALLYINVILLSSNLIVSGEHEVAAPISSEPQRFTHLEDCGENLADSETFEFEQFSVFTKSGHRVDLANLTMHFRIIDEDALEDGYPFIFRSFTKSALSNAFGGIEASDIAATNLCDLVLNSHPLEYALRRYGMELVALDASTPQYKIHERAAPIDEPSD